MAMIQEIKAFKSSFPDLKKNYEEVYIKFHDLVENDIKKFENQ